MSAFAMMHLKYPTLLEFDKERQTPELKHNLKQQQLTEPFSQLFTEVQRGGGLKPFRFKFKGVLNDRYLLAVDGTGLYSSGTCQCDECCVKNKGKPNESYYHQMLAGCIVHPNHSVVLPLAPEPIVQPKFSSWMRIFWEISAFSARRVMQPMAVALGKWRNAAEDAEIFQKTAERSGSSPKR